MCVKSVRSSAFLIGVLSTVLIPFAVSSLAGLTHLRSCSAAAGAPFTVSFPAGATRPVVSSALVIERSAPEPKSCDGMSLEAQVQPQRNGTIRVLLPVKNTSTSPWRASVRVTIDGTSYPVRVGEVGPGASADTSVEDRVPRGESQLTTRLIVGP